MKNLNKKGITIFEILLAIAIVSILAATVLPGFAKIKKVQILKSATETIVSVIGNARSQTLSSLNSSNYGIHFATDKVVLFTGTVFSSGSTSNQDVNLLSPATISSINLNNSGQEIYFNRLSGLPNTSGTITVSVLGLSAKTITISSNGLASVN